MNRGLLIQTELREIAGLSAPMIIALMGTILIGLVDTIIVGQYRSATELAAVGAGASLFTAALVIGYGFLSALDTLVSQAFGANQRYKMKQLFIQGLWLSFVLGFVTCITTGSTAYFYEHFGIDPEIVAPAKDYMYWVSLSAFPVFAFTALQRYWQAVGKVGPITWITLFGNTIHVIFAVVLVPTYGVKGVAIATLVTRVVMMILLVIYTLPRIGITRKDSWALRFDQQKDIMKLGGPAAIQYVSEVGAFTVATQIAGRLGTIPLASHHLALTIASFTFMMPLGLANAGAVRVGYWIGAKHPNRAEVAGWLSIGLGAVIMIASSLAFSFFPRSILEIFSKDPAVLDFSVKVLLIAGIFQIFDGIQVTTAGVLRGIGDTTSTMFTNLIGHYPIGMLVGLLLCFKWGLGLTGIWIGLTVGLFSVAFLNLIIWSQTIRALVRTE
ncbi:MAG: MATE family efflux transporter [Xanthomonadaceae bacterium]|nr:MATE family efflux transporter [Xanthomonadaceae bacterium]